MAFSQKKFNAKPSEKARRAASGRARYAAEKKLTEQYGAAKAKQIMANKDMGHKVAKQHGGSDNISNFKLEDRSKNRGKDNNDWRKKK